MNIVFMKAGEDAVAYDEINLLKEHEGDSNA